MPDTHKTKFDPFEPGDRVVIHYNGKIHKLSTVERTTKLHAIVDGTKYRLGNGYRASSGDTWNLVSISHVTPGAEIALETARLRARLASQRWADVPLDQLRAILTILEHNSD